MNFKVLDIKPDALEIIESHFQGLYSGDLGLSSIKGGQSRGPKISIPCGEVSALF